MLGLHCLLHLLPAFVFSLKYTTALNKTIFYIVWFLASSEKKARCNSNSAKFKRKSKFKSTSNTALMLSTPEK